MYICTLICVLLYVYIGEFDDDDELSEYFNENQEHGGQYTGHNSDPRKVIIDEDNEDFDFEG